MEIFPVEIRPVEVEADVLAFGIADPPELPPAAQELDRRLSGRLARLLEDGEIKGSLGSVAVLHTRGEVTARRIAAVGLGKVTALDADALRTAVARAAERTGAVGGRTLAWILGGDELPLTAADQARAAVEGAVLAAYDPGRWKTGADDERPQLAESLVLCGTGAAAVRDEAVRAAVVARWTNRCRDLVNTPANELTPTKLAELAEEAAAKLEHVRVETLGPEEIRAAGMGAFAAVARGSREPARLISLSYEPPAPARPDVVLGLVGKAITFDSGGLSLKPAQRMDEMKYDMAGGGAALTGFCAVAELGLPVRARAVVGSCENMPGGHAYRPGDIVTAANGMTIEVTNTDAEGRLVLADALWYARESGATHVVDFATLTGGIVVAIGDFYAGLFGNDASWIEEVRAAAEESGDHAWPMPIHDTYKRYYQSTFADATNSSDLRQAQPVYAARFLQEFAGEGPWAHLDIAGTAFLERGRGDVFADRGATGYGVRLIAELASRLAGAGP